MIESKPVKRILRLINFAIDLSAILLVLVLLVIGYLMLLAKSTNIIEYMSDEFISNSFGFLMYFTIFIYYFTLEAIFGRTLGKIITKTKVVDWYGEKPKTKQILIRSAIRLIPIDWFTYFSITREGWHDSGSSTMLIKNNKTGANKI